MHSSRFVWRALTALGTLLAALLTLGSVAAQSGALALDWWTVDGGGEVASSTGGYTLSGTIGQPDAGDAATAGNLTLEGGFWERSRNSALHLPLVAAAAAAPEPDLVIEQIALNPARTSFRAGEQVEVLVTVANRGSAAAAPFWVDLYLNPGTQPTVNQRWSALCALKPCFGAAWGLANGLAAGQRVTLSSRNALPGYSTWPGWFPAGSSDLYAYADSWNAGAAEGAVAERDESNNLGHLGGLTVAGTNPPFTPALLQAERRLP